jgi:hypothetical protein
MSQDWNSPDNPWQSTDLPWKDVNMPWNSTDLPWKAGGGADTVDNLLANDVSSTSSVTAPTLVDVPPASNLLTQSSAFDHADWTKLNVTISANADGTGDALIETTADDFHGVTQNVTKAASSLTYDLSVRAKLNSPATRNRITLQLDDNAGNGRSCCVDIAGGEELGVAPSSYGAGFSGGTVTVTPEADSWYLCEFNGVTTNTATTVRVIFALEIGSGTDISDTSYAGDDTKGMILDAAILVAA